MSYLLPESPILLFPSLAKEVGLEAAVLCALYQQQLPGNDLAAELQLSHSQWLALGQFWDEEQLAQLTSILVTYGILEASFASDGSVVIAFNPKSEEFESEALVIEPEEELEEEPEQVSRLPVMEALPEQTPEQLYQQSQYPELQDTPYYPDAGQSVPAASMPPQQPVHQPAATPTPNPGPAPTFGGSIGWARKARQGDELHALFQQHEQRNKQLKPMALGWQPSENFFAILPRHSITPEFAMGCLDEFVLYWLDKDRKETNWDQKFLGWVKREWVKKQTQEGRQQRINQEQQTGYRHEDTRRDSREKRKRVTAAVMDIKDTDW